MHYLRNLRVQRFLIQAVVLVTVVLVLAGMYLTARENLDRLGITSGFHFLDRTTGWDISFSLIDYSINSTYQRAFLVGFINTVFAGLISIILATILGVLIGMARVSDNAAFRLFGTTYVEIFRNIPLLLQGLFWYAILTHLPGPRQVEASFLGTMLTSRGLYLPVPNLDSSQLVAAVGTTLLALIVLTQFLRVRGPALSAPAYWSALVIGFAVALSPFILVPLIFGGGDSPLISMPALDGLRIRGGIVIAPELSALVLALVFFGASYIGEIVRGGLLSVKKGQLEAARALGLSPLAVYWLVRIPLALRTIVPPMGNQFIWLLKGTTIGLAIGFSDLFMVSSTSINQSGQTIEIIFLMMLGYLVINYTIGTLMNLLNGAIALKGENAR